MKVLVCDDEANRCQEVIEAIRRSGIEEIDTTALAATALRDELTKLFESVSACLENPENYTPPDLQLAKADLVIFDNNLAHLDIKGTRLTAESVVGYVRAFTAAPYVISLNKNPDVDFDLRFLVGDYETRADLALNTNHLQNLALWTGNPADASNGFAPWYWPSLARAPERRRAQIAFIKDRLDESVLLTVGIPTDDEALGFLSLHAKGALSPDAHADADKNGKEGVPIEGLTFRDVFTARSRSLPNKDERKKLADGATAGNAYLQDLLSRVVAADIDLWFRRDVIGPQEMLVDVPHLLMRMPFLLGTTAGTVNGWNRAIAESKVPFGMDDELYKSFLSETRFEQGIWSERPVFRWSALKRDEGLNALFFKSDQSAWVEAVFCEDQSSFVERPKGGGQSPVEFTAEFEGPWSRRYVAKLEGFRYTPLSRLFV